jgi:hypothetical protein
MEGGARRLMKRGALIAALSAIILTGPAHAQSCPNPLQALEIRQRSYAQLRSDLVAGRRPWLYLYVPDVKTGLGGAKAVDLWLVEGVYGPAFPQAAGTMDASAFEKMRKSANVRARPIRVEFDSTAPSAARSSRQVTIGKDTVTIEVGLKTYLFGSDRAEIRICR